KGIKVRIIGGKGRDEIIDESRIRGWTKKTFVYDTKANNKLRLGSEGKDLTSNNPYYNEYDYKAFMHNLYMPLASFGYNTDDGIFTGLGCLIKMHRFKKFPFAASHKLNANYAFATNAYNFKYDGIFTSAFFGLDLNLHLEYRSPTYTQNYFGLGNNSKLTNTDWDYHRVRIGLININPELSKSFKNYNTLAIGILYQSFDLEKTPGRFISEVNLSEINSYIFKRLNYFGLKASYVLDVRNNKVIPSRGILWNTEVKSYYGISDSARAYSQLKSELSLYMSFRKPYRTIFAFRLGGSINSGDYEFFQACSLGGKYNLRGYRATRFSGDACLYQNSELRFKLFNFSNYISKGQVGIIGFNDIGRVWLKGENSKKWHHGYGGGLWISPFNMAVVCATYDFSQEDDMLSVKFNFLF
ncbi:MAG: BamA/TamA family outer membrane protein, partial [Bacteroidales bacterium]